jgi:hypothetical protein
VKIFYFVALKILEQDFKIVFQDIQNKNILGFIIIGNKIREKGVFKINIWGQGFIKNSFIL